MKRFAKKMEPAFLKLRLVRNELRGKILEEKLKLIRMNLQRFFVLLICCSILAGCGTTKTIHSNNSAIAVTIPFGSYDEGARKGVFETDHFHVLLTNRSQEPVRLWQEWCSWGYSCLQFEIVCPDGSRHMIKKGPASWTRNFPDYVILQPNASVVWDVNFNTNTWEDLAWLPNDRTLQVKMRAIYSAAKPDDEISKVTGENHMGVWTGEAKSDFYDFVLSNWKNSR